MREKFSDLIYSILEFVNLIVTEYRKEVLTKNNVYWYNRI